MRRVNGERQCCNANVIYRGPRNKRRISKCERDVKMNRPRILRGSASILVGAIASSLLVAGNVATAAGHQPNASAAIVSTFAAGLNNPRGLKFGPDGNLYVAEGGLGGTNSTIGQCTQVIPDVGPYTGSQDGARISKIDTNGVRTTFVDNLPSSQTSPALGSLVSGVADVAFIGDTLYAVLAGAGCSHGVVGIPNGIIRVNPGGTWTLVANLSAYQQANPVKNPEEDDFEPDGTWYSMIAIRGDLYAVEPNHGEIVKVTTDGDITRVIDVSASQGHVVPTALAYHGNFYVGNLGVFPQEIGSSKIWKVTPSGQIKVDTEGFDMVLGLVFDDRARMYVLEMTSGNPAPTPFTGRITRVDPSGAREVIADGLFFPTGMTFGPDGNLYVSNVGFGPPPVGLGQILKIELAD